MMMIMMMAVYEVA